MREVLKLVYRYRQLAGKCETGAGLDFDEIGDLSAIEASFADPGGHSSRRLCERDHVRSPVRLEATLWRRQFRDRVRIFDMAPGGFVCEGAPFLQEDDRAEVVVQSDTDPTLSYRFMAEVAWTRDREEDCVIGFRFVGTPVALRRRSVPASSEAAPVVEPPSDEPTVVDHPPKSAQAPQDEPPDSERLVVDASASVDAAA